MWKNLKYFLSLFLIKNKEKCHGDFCYYKIKVVCYKSNFMNYLLQN